MTPADVADDIITQDSLFPWLHAIAPAVEPLRRLREGAGAEQAGAEPAGAHPAAAEPAERPGPAEPLRPAA